MLEMSEYQWAYSLVDSSRVSTFLISILLIVYGSFRWPEAVPIEDIRAETVASAFYVGWITRFGVPSRVTTDQGRQFESSLFRSLSNLLGIQKLRTTPYHPQSNGLIEEFHRPLKAAIKASGTEKWTEVLPTILMNFRAAFKPDIQATTAELVYGTPLRLPGEVFTPSSETSPKQLVEDLRANFQNIRPSPTSNHGSSKVFIHPQLDSCSHVFVRNDKVKKPLQPPYDGPFKVLHRRAKTYDVDIRGNKVTISLDRIKPAFLIEADTLASSDTARTTRSGRRVRFPDFYVSSLTLRGESAVVAPPKPPQPAYI